MTKYMVGRTPELVLPRPDDLYLEKNRVEALIQEVSNQLTDSDMELSASVRLGGWHRELQAYLHGIRFALGEELPPEALFHSEVSPFRRSGRM